MRSPIIEYAAELGPGLTRVLEAGPRDGPVVLALHGMGSRADRWRPAMPELGRGGFRVLAIDLPGHGLATKYDELDCSTTAMSDALAEFCRALRPASAKVLVLGASLGALYAAAFGLASRELVAGVVLIAALGLEPLGEEARSAAAAALLQPLSREDVVRKLERLLADRRLITDALVDEELYVNASPGASGSITAYARYFGGEIDSDVVGERLAASDLPTMLVWGEHDRSSPVDVGRRAHEKIAHSRFVTIADAGHAPYFERPYEFCTQVLPFLEAQARG